MRIILPHGWVRRNSTKDCRQKRRDYWNNKLSDPKNKTANIWSHINSVSGRGKRSSVDGIQPVEFKSFLFRGFPINSVRLIQYPLGF